MSAAIIIIICYYYYYKKKKSLFSVLVTVHVQYSRTSKFLNSLIFWHPKILLLSLQREVYWINPSPSKKCFSFQRGKACGYNSHASWIFWSTQLLRVNLVSKQGMSPTHLISRSLWILCVVWRGAWFLLVIDLPGLHGLDVRGHSARVSVWAESAFDCFSLGLTWILTYCLILKFSKRKCQVFFYLIHSSYMWIKIKEQHIWIYIFHVSIHSVL